MVNVVAPPVSPIGSALAEIVNTTASSLVISVLVSAVPMETSPFGEVAPDRVAVTVSVSSTRLSSNASTANVKVGPAKVSSKVSVLPARLTPAVAPAALESAVRNAGV